MGCFASLCNILPEVAQDTYRQGSLSSGLGVSVCVLLRDELFFRNQISLSHCVDKREVLELFCVSLFFLGIPHVGIAK